MVRRRIIGLSAAALVVAGIVGYVVLVPPERVRPLPATIPEAMFAPIEVPFTHRWSKSTSHPLLAASAIDIDGDGRDEVFLGGSDQQSNALLAWRENKLVDIAEDVGLQANGATYGALSMDADGDGKVDLISVGHSGVDLWRNMGGRFERQSLNVKLPEGGVPMAVTAADFDHDGGVDLYISVFVAPELFRSPVFNDPAHAKPNILLRNNGDLTFSNVTDDVTAGLQNTFTASFVDLDLDGWHDLVLAQNTGEVEILQNLRNGKFARADFRSGYGFWMGLAFGDVDRDGDPDLFLSNLGNSIPSFLVKGDRRDDQRPANEWLLLRNDGDFRFIDMTVSAGVSGFGFSWGGAFEDINLDGVLDLIVAQNYVKWPVHGLIKLPGKVLIGAGGNFYTSNAAPNASFGHVPLIADLDGDGRNDILWANMNGQARAYLNRTDGRFVAVRLPDSPASIGARIKLEGVPAPVHTFIAGEGLTSDRTTQYTFGLAATGPLPTTLVVEWPDGRQSRIAAPSLNKVTTVSAP